MGFTSGGKGATVIRDIVFNALAVAAGAIAPILATVLVARALEPVQVGMYGLLTWIIILGIGVATLGIPTAIARYVAELEEDKRLAAGLLRHVLRRRAAIAAIVAVAATGVGWWMTGAWSLAVAAGAAIVPAVISILCQHVYRGHQKFKALAGRQVVIAIINLSFVVVVLQQGWGLTGLAAVLAIQAGMSAVIYLRGISLSASPVPHQVLLRFGALGRSLSMLAIIDLVVWHRSEVFFLGVLRSADDVAMYTLPFALVGAMMLVPGSIGGVLLPRIASAPGNRARGGLVYAEGMRYLSVAALPLAVGAVLFAEPLIRFLFGAAYHSAVNPLRIMSITSAVTVIASAGSAVLVAEEATGFMIRWGAVAAAVNIVLALLLIPSLGANGAALANGGAQIFAVTVTLGYLVRVRHVRVPWRTLYRLVLAAITSGLCARLLWLFTEPLGLWGLIAAGVVGSTAYLVCGILIGELRWRFGAARPVEAQ